MRDQPNPARPGRAPGQKRCPACQQPKPVSDFYTTSRGKPSGYCKSCQKAISRRSRHRRTAAIRALIATVEKLPTSEALPRLRTLERSLSTSKPPL